MLYFLAKFFRPEKKRTRSATDFFEANLFNVAFDLKQVSSNFCYSFQIYKLNITNRISVL